MEAFVKITRSFHPASINATAREATDSRQGDGIPFHATEGNGIQGRCKTLQLQSVYMHVLLRLSHPFPITTGGKCYV